MSEVLPRGWMMTSLGEVCHASVAQGQPTEQPVQYIDIGSIDRSAKRIGTTDVVTVNDAPTRARQWVSIDDVLVSMTRPNLNAVAQVRPELDGAVASTGFDILRSAGVVPEWIFYRVRTNQFIKDMCEGLQGVVYPAIRPHDVRRHRIPLPPFREQRRIVAAIESYFTRLDDAVASLERVQRNLKRYRASVLKAAVEGRLVPTEAELARADGRDYEPASVLLERILTERRRRWVESELAKMKAKGKTPTDDKWKARYAEPTAPDTADLPELPEGWYWTSMGQLLTTIEAGKSFRCIEQPPDAKQVGVVKVSSVTWGTFNECESKTCIRQEQVNPDFFIRTGDLLFSRANTIALVGAAVIVGSVTKTLMLSDKILRLRVVGKLERWLLWVLRSSHGRKEIERLATGNQDSMRNIGQINIRRIRIPLPPQIEMERIVEAIETHVSTTEQSESALRSAELRCARLRQSILKWAFEGRLVDQDPTDEPASKLLERIKSERAAEPARSPTPRPRRSTSKRKSS